MLQAGHFLPEPGKCFLNQVYSHDPDLITDSNRTICIVRVKGYGQVGRQGPGRGGPDERKNFPASTFFCSQFRYCLSKVIQQRELDID